MKHVLSYGGGVQTRALVQKILTGDYARPDLVCFGDTQREPPAVYEAVEDDRRACEAAGIAFAVNTKGDLGDHAGNGSIHVPLYTFNLEWFEEDGVRYAPFQKKGQLFRTCTDRFKIAAVLAECRAQGWGHRKEDVTVWLGFSTDEVHRIGSGVELPAWVQRGYPLIELDMRRSDCESVLRAAGKPIVKSACYFCPWKSRWSWSDLKTNDPISFARAVIYDESIRHSRPGLLAYCHQDRIPLSDVPFLERGLFDSDNDRCETGFCFG